MRSVIFVFVFSSVSATPVVAQYVTIDTLIPTLDYPEPDPVVTPATGDTGRL